MKLHLFHYSMINLHFTSGMVLRVGEFQKDGRSPFFTEGYFGSPKLPWEVRYDNSYPNVMFDDKDGKWKLYYTLFIVDPDAERTPLEERPHTHYAPSAERITGVCYAESHDGVTWERPNLGIVEFQGSRENNILFKHAHGTGVFLDSAETDPDRRYKLITKLEYSTRNHFMVSAFSPDGITWSEPIPWRNYNPKADTHNFVFRDPDTREFVLITRVMRDGIRVVARSTSRDFVTWSEPVEVMRGRGPGAQVYSMPVLPYDGTFLGFPSIYREGDRSAPDFDLVDLGLAFSRTTEHWELLSDSDSPLPRGEGSYPDGAFDSSCVYAAMPLPVGDELVMYYMGGNGPHTDHRETSFGRASIHRDKVAYYTPSDAAEGTLVIGPLSIFGSTIELFADVDEGGRIEYDVVRDLRGGSALRGFERENCTPIDRSGVTRLRFDNADFEGLGGEHCFIRAFVRDARLYTLAGDVMAKHML